MKTIIFDFDGTLVDSLPLAINLFNKLRVGSRELSKADIAHLRELSARQVVRAVGIPMWKVPKLLALGRTEASKHIETLDLFSGMKPLLSRLDDYQLFVMTSNSANNVHRFLRHHKINHLFKKVYGNVGIFGKAAVLRHIINANKLDRLQTVYIGDEVRDVEGAKRANVPVIAVSWGYNGAKILSQAKPNYIVHTRNQLSKTIPKLFSD